VYVCVRVCTSKGGSRAYRSGWCWNTLQHIETHCTISKQTATNCTTWFTRNESWQWRQAHEQIHCITLQHIATHLEVAARPRTNSSARISLVASLFKIQKIQKFSQVSSLWSACQNISIELTFCPFWIFFRFPRTFSSSLWNAIQNVRGKSDLDTIKDVFYLPPFLNMEATKEIV